MSAIRDLSLYYIQSALKNVRIVETDSLVLFNYTDQCVYARAWTDITRSARGIIFNKNTGALVAKPFPKFFNLGEMEETQLLNLPNEPYEVFEKVDGSLGIIYFYNNQWNMATRGSFSSPQAVKGLEILKKYKISALTPGFTYLCEIIYPENKIIVNYGSEEKLVLLGMYHQEEEISFDHVEEVAAALQMPIATKYDYTIEQMIELQKTIPKDQEGFVVRFKNGLRVKIKGHEYLAIHKMIANMSPLSFWESMINGKVNQDYVQQLPEEFRSTFEVFITQLEGSYNKIKEEITFDLTKLPKDSSGGYDPKTIGMFLKETKDIKHPGAMFPVLRFKPEAVDGYIMKHIRPTGNVLV